MYLIYTITLPGVVIVVIAYEGGRASPLGGATVAVTRRIQRRVSLLKHWS